MLRTAEFDILLALIERPQRTLTRDQLLDLARGRAASPFDPRDRRSHQPAAQTDRGRSEGAGDDQDGPERRLLLCRSGCRLGSRAVRRRWRLDSIAMTVALTVVVAMGLDDALQRVVKAGLEYTGIYPWETSEDPRIRFSAALFPVTMVSLAEALDTVSNAERPAIIAAARRPEIRIELRYMPLPDLVNSGAREALDSGIAFTCSSPLRARSSLLHNHNSERPALDKMECSSNCRSTTATGCCSPRASSRRRCRVGPRPNSRMLTSAPGLVSQRFS
jgi:hypothetical protein